MLLTHVTGTKAKVRANFLRKFTQTLRFFGISGFRVRFGPFGASTNENLSCGFPSILGMAPGAARKIVVFVLLRS